MFSLEASTGSGVIGDFSRLGELHQLNRQMLRDITAGAGGTIDKVLAQVTLDISDAAVRRSPYLTGTLASAHRGKMVGAGEGLVFIDPGVTNPVYGGRPAQYGPLVHERKAWFGDTVAQDAPRILVAAAETLINHLEDIYE